MTQILWRAIGIKNEIWGNSGGNYRNPLMEKPIIHHLFTKIQLI